MPHGEAIDAADGHELLETDLPVAALAAALRSAGGRAVVSHNAGRFVCNYLLFRSLQRSRARAPRWHSLFVHLPCVDGAAGARQLLEVRARAALRCAWAQSRACNTARLLGICLPCAGAQGRGTQRTRNWQCMRLPCGMKSALGRCAAYCSPCGIVCSIPRVSLASPTLFQ